MNNDKLHEYINAIETELRRKTGELITYAGVSYNVHDRAARIELIRRLTEDYTAANDRYPDGALLERLADAVLNEELTDQSRRKIYEKYPFLSTGQYGRRASREVPLSSVSDEISTIEITLIHYESNEERLQREIKSEYKRYAAFNKIMPVTLRKATEEELARIKPTPLYSRSRIDYEWSMDVRRRDGFACQKCGRNRGKMHAHHIESYHANVELRTDLNNGVTLCDRCHFEFHDIYGRRYNTREQFNEWMRGDYYEL